MTKSFHSCSECSEGFCKCEDYFSYAKNLEILDAASVAASITLGGEIEKMIEKEATGSGDYLNPKFVRSNGVTEVTIDSKAEIVEKEFENKKTGELEKKNLVECYVVTNDEKESRVLWSMNKTSRNIVVDVLGTDENTWIGKLVPITVSADNGMNAAVYPDQIRFAQLHKSKGTLD